jgi:DNA-binding transcriptional LysR family regulator
MARENCQTSAPSLSTRKGSLQRVEGQLLFNGIFQALDAALAGFGLAYVPEDLAWPHLAEGRLRLVREDWCPPFPGFHLYYPSRRQASPPFALLATALRHSG